MKRLLALAVWWAAILPGHAADAIRVELTHVIHPSQEEPRTITKASILTQSGKPVDVEVGVNHYTITPTLAPNQMLTVKIDYAIRKANAKEDEWIASPHVTVKPNQHALLKIGDQEFLIVARFEKN